jgi:hypothetical protein
MAIWIAARAFGFGIPKQHGVTQLAVPAQVLDAEKLRQKHQENGLRLERRQSRPNARELEKILILSEHDVRVQP